MLRALLSRFSLRRSAAPVDGPRALADFIDANSAFVAQSALYGYVKTRAGFEYFRLFEDPVFVRSVNIAKWNIYAECVGDLSLFCGAHLLRRLPASAETTSALMRECAETIFAARGAPPDAGEAYSELTRAARARIAAAVWTELQDDETPFARSPEALVYWAPVADLHKKHDAAIVRNSVIFKWKEVRDNFRRRVDSPALRRALSPGCGRIKRIAPPRDSQKYAARFL